MRDTLKLYGIFVIVWSCLEVLGGLCLGGIAAMAGTVIANAPAGQFQQSGGPPPEAMVGLVVGFYGCFGALTLAVGILGLVAGIKIVQVRGGRMAGIVWAGVNLLSIPIGTALGIWGLIVLLNEDAKTLLDGRGNDRNRAAYFD